MKIQKEDILAIAKTIGFEPTEKEINEVLSRYSSEQKEDSDWHLVVKKILSELKDEKKQKLVDVVLEQIKKDVNDGDVTAIEGLLQLCPDSNLINYLPEELWGQFE